MIVYARVYAGGADIGVAEPFLNFSNVGASIQRVSGRRGTRGAVALDGPERHKCR